MKYLILCLFLVGCMNPPPEELNKTLFNFNQRVKITGGFYQGQKGRIIADGHYFSDCYKQYGVIIDNFNEVVLICNKHMRSE